MSASYLHISGPHVVPTCWSWNSGGNKTLIFPTTFIPPPTFIPWTFIHNSSFFNYVLYIHPFTYIHCLNIHRSFIYSLVIYCTFILIYSFIIHHHHLLQFCINYYSFFPYISMPSFISSLLYITHISFHFLNIQLSFINNMKTLNIFF